jgi:hypothetical protein
VKLCYYYLACLVDVRVGKAHTIEFARDAEMLQMSRLGPASAIAEAS